MKHVTLIGDSIRWGYQPFVRDLLAGVADVWGPQSNGGTSRNVLAHIDAFARPRPETLTGPHVVHVNAGLHDIKKEYGSDEPQVSLEEYALNVRRILGRLKAERPTPRVIWATMTPVNEARHNPIKGFNRFESDVVAYNAVGLRVANEMGVAVNDLHALVTREGRDHLLGFDGVHFTPAGEARLARAVAECVRKYWSESE